MRREYLDDDVVSFSSKGLPLHAQGILNGKLPVMTFYGITPACAGNTI